MEMNKLLIIIATLFVAGCSSPQDSCDWEQVEVAQVFRESCTGGTAGGILSSGRTPQCRIELTNGDRANIEAPVMEGDELSVCYNGEHSYPIIWERHNDYKALITAIGRVTSRPNGD